MPKLDINSFIIELASLKCFFITSQSQAFGRWAVSEDNLQDSFLLLPHGVWGLNSGGQAWQQVQSGIPSQKLNQVPQAVSLTLALHLAKRRMENKTNPPQIRTSILKWRKKWKKFFPQTRTGVFTRPKHLHKRLEEHEVSGSFHIEDKVTLFCSLSHQSWSGG